MIFYIDEFLGILSAISCYALFDMKKILICVVLLLVVLGLGGGVGYYFLVIKPASTTATPVTETVPEVATPPPLSLSGNTFAVPAMQGVTTKLDMLSQTSRRDYPMGRFTSVDGTIRGSLVAFDEFVSAYENNVRAVPIAVDTGAGATFYYLAILEGDDMRHATSVPLDDRIKVSSVTRSGDLVTVSYYVHDRGQAMEEMPNVGTSAIINIATGAVVQAGRHPASEVSMGDIFEGKYFWITTTYADGKIVKPDDLDHFALGIANDSVTLETDCNTGTGSFTAGATSPAPFTVSALSITKKTCGSQYESEYFTMFGKVTTYSKTEAGKLILHFADGGKMDFIAASKKEGYLHPAPATSTATSTR